MFSKLLDQKCWNSSDCQENVRKFCNFNNGDSGYCDYCRPDIYDSCDQVRFVTQRGEQECKSICEGNISSSYESNK